MLDRRNVIKAVATLPLAAVLADPTLARAAAAGLEEVSIEAAGKRVKAALAQPVHTPAGAVMLVHEWWGLNDQIKAVAAELASEGFLALAVDLYDGAVASAPAEAKRLAGALAPAVATEVLGAWIDWLKAHRLGNGKVATVGWCMGGGWSLRASLARPVDATIVYYGNVARPAAQLAALAGPVLGHFASRDRWINEAMVSGFESAMAAAGKELEYHWYEADHAFANPTQARYDADDAALAWARTLAFLKRHL